MEKQAECSKFKKKSVTLHRDFEGDDYRYLKPK